MRSTLYYTLTIVNFFDYELEMQIFCCEAL